MPLRLEGRGTSRQAPSECASAVRVLCQRFPEDVGSSPRSYPKARQKMPSAVHSKCAEAVRALPHKLPEAPRSFTRGYREACQTPSAVHGGDTQRALVRCPRSTRSGSPKASTTWASILAQSYHPQNNISKKKTKNYMNHNVMKTNKTSMVRTPIKNKLGFVVPSPQQ